MIVNVTFKDYMCNLDFNDVSRIEEDHNELNEEIICIYYLVNNVEEKMNIMKRLIKNIIISIK